MRGEDLLIRGGHEKPHPGEAGVSYISSRRGDAHRPPWKGCRLRHDCDLWDHASMFVDGRDRGKDERLWTFSGGSSEKFALM